MTQTEARIFLARKDAMYGSPLAVLLSAIGITISSQHRFLVGFPLMVFFLFFMSYRLRGFNRVYRLWRDVNHEILTFRVAAPHLLPIYLLFLFQLALTMGLPV